MEEKRERPRLLIAACALCVLATLSAARGAVAQPLPCQPEPALDRMAAALLLQQRDQRLRAAEVDRALRASGSDLHHVHVLRGSLDRLAVARQRIARAAEEQRAPIACGSAQGERLFAIVFSPRFGGLRLEGAQLRISLMGELSGHVIFESPEGEISRRRVHDGALLALESPRGTAQLVVDDGADPRPIAVLRFALEGDHGDGDYGNGETVSRHRENMIVESFSWGRRDTIDTALTQLREAHDLLPLRDNRLLREEAARHAARVCRERHTSHTLGGDPQTRLAERGIRSRVTGEVIARARDQEEAFALLLQSPSHRAAMLDRRFTDVGVAIQQSPSEVCVVVTLSAWPRYIPPR